MTQATLDYTTPVTRPLSNTDAVEQYFRAHAREWISALTLLEIGGVLSGLRCVRDCRKAPRLMAIEWKEERVHGKKRSYYRFIPN